MVGVATIGGGATVTGFKPGGGAIGSLIGYVPGVGGFGVGGVRPGNPPLVETLGE